MIILNLLEVSVIFSNISEIKNFYNTIASKTSKDISIAYAILKENSKLFYKKDGFTKLVRPLDFIRLVCMYIYIYVINNSERRQTSSVLLSLLGH